MRKKSSLPRGGVPYYAVVEEPAGATRLRDVSVTTIFLSLTVVALVILLLFGLIHNEYYDWNHLRSLYNITQSTIATYQTSSDAEVRACATNLQALYREYLVKLRDFPRWRAALVVALILCWFGWMAAFCQPRPYAVAIVILLAAFLFIWGLVGFLFYHGVYVF